MSTHTYIYTYRAEISWFNIELPADLTWKIIIESSKYCSRMRFEKAYKKKKSHLCVYFLHDNDWFFFCSLKDGAQLEARPLSEDRLAIKSLSLCEFRENLVKRRGWWSNTRVPRWRRAILFLDGNPFAPPKRPFVIRCKLARSWLNHAKLFPTDGNGYFRLKRIDASWHVLLRGLQATNVCVYIYDVYPVRKLDPWLIENFDSRSFFEIVVRAMKMIFKVRRII